MSWLPQSDIPGYYNGVEVHTVDINNYRLLWDGRLFTLRCEVSPIGKGTTYNLLYDAKVVAVWIGATTFGQVTVIIKKL